MGGLEFFPCPSLDSHRPHAGRSTDRQRHPGNISGHPFHRTRRFQGAANLSSVRLPCRAGACACGVHYARSRGSRFHSSAGEPTVLI